MTSYIFVQFDIHYFPNNYSISVKFCEIVSLENNICAFSVSNIVLLCLIITLFHNLAKFSDLSSMHHIHRSQ